MNLYLLYKSLHLISVISWMAGLLYLPRIFVYHSEAKDNSQKEVFKVKGKSDTTGTIRSTHHGPIITGIHSLKPLNNAGRKIASFTPSTLSTLFTFSSIIPPEEYLQIFNLGNNFFYGDSRSIFNIL